MVHQAALGLRLPDPAALQLAPRDARQPVRVRLHLVRFRGHEPREHEHLRVHPSAVPSDGQQHGADREEQLLQPDPDVERQDALLPADRAPKGHPAAGGALRHRCAPAQAAAARGVWLNEEKSIRGEEVNSPLEYKFTQKGLDYARSKAITPASAFSAEYLKFIQSELDPEVLDAVGYGSLMQD